MTRKKLIGLLIRVLVVLVVLGAAGFQLWWEFVGFEEFDAEFYLGPKVSYDVQRYAGVLADYVDDRGMVAYAALQAQRKQLDNFVRSMASLNRTEYDAWDTPTQIAFWINAYNALTLKVIIDHYPIQPGLIGGQVYPNSSIRQIPGAWTKTQFLVMGKRMTLDGIEHEVLRAEFKEPRIHVAMVCAAMSCPPLRNEPYVAARLDQQFDDQARRFLAGGGNFRVDRAAGVVHLSSIFTWFGEDFAAAYRADAGFGDHDDTVRAVLNYIRQYVSESDARYLQAGEFTVSYLDYDWSLNEQTSR